MFFLNKPLVCYLSSSSLEILTSNNNQKFPFPPELVQHSEIVDENKFAEALQQFLNQINLKKGTGVIVLSHQIVFSGEINISDKSITDPVEQFLTSVPLARDTISSLIIKNKNTETIHATNRKLYEIVIKIFSQKNIGIYSVVPVNALLDVPENQNPTIQVVKSKIGNKKVLMQYNFLQSKQLTQDNLSIDQKELLGGQDTNKSMRKQYIMLSLSLLLFGGATLYLLLWSGTLANPWFRKSLNVSPKVTTSPKPTSFMTTQPSPTIKPFDKSLVKIQILNGSGIEGQAGKLSNILQSKGYKNIATGNATDSGKLTSVVYSKSVSVDIPKDIADSLKKDFPNITLQEATQSAEFDVVITTGNSK